MSKLPPRSAATAISTTTWNADRASTTTRFDEHEQRSRDRRGEQLLLRAAVAVDDHAQAGEDRGQRNEQSDGPDGHESDVVDVGVQPAERLAQGGGDHGGEQDRGQQRDGDLARVVGGQRGATPGERHQARSSGGSGRGGGTAESTGSDRGSGHGSGSFRVAVLGGFGDLGAGEPEVNVVERRRPRREAGGLDAGVGDGGDRVAGRPAVEGDRET